jgi:hypothetical protein
MDGKHAPRRDEPPLGLLARGYIGVGLSLGGLAHGGEVGQGLAIVGTVITVSGGLCFAIECLALWARRRGR